MDVFYFFLKVPCEVGRVNIFLQFSISVSNCVYLLCSPPAPQLISEGAKVWQAHMQLSAWAPSKNHPRRYKNISIFERRKCDQKCSELPYILVSSFSVSEENKNKNLKPISVINRAWTAPKGTIRQVRESKIKQKWDEEKRERWLLSCKSLMLILSSTGSNMEKGGVPLQDGTHTPPNLWGWPKKISWSMVLKTS